jgi:hypothetical protein
MTGTSSLQRWIWTLARSPQGHLGPRAQERGHGARPGRSAKDRGRDSSQESEDR